MARMPVIAGLAIGIAFVILFSMARIPGGVNDDSLDNVVITMERTPCLGNCPAYLLIVYGNGTVAYKGFAFVAIMGNQTAQISRDQVKELAGEFYKIGYFSLQDRYEEPVTDLPSTTTSITIDGMAKKSVYRYGFGPEKLVQLEDKIDEIAGTDRWIKGILDMPSDFVVHYSYGIGLDYVLDTANNSFSATTCDDPPRQHVTLTLSEQELYTIWQSAGENDFFSLSDFTEGCPDSGNCVMIIPANQSTLKVVANGQIHEVKFNQSYELNHQDRPGSDFQKFKNIVKTIESVLSAHDLPSSGCAYL